MGRRIIVRDSKKPYHAVARAHNRHWFPLPKVEMWEIYQNQLKFIQTNLDVDIYAFVLMDNHFHLMLRTRRANIDEVMYYFMKNSCLEVQKRAKVINSIYGGRYKASLLNESDYIFNCYKYILRNPVEVNLCKNIEDYPYSAFFFANDNRVRKIETTAIPFSKEYSFLDSRETCLRWLNEGLTIENAKSIKTGLNRPIFKYAINDSSKKVIRPEIIHPDLMIAERLWDSFMPEEE